mgnify:FL=1
MPFILPWQAIVSQVGRLEAAQSVPQPACVKLMSQTFFTFFDGKSLEPASLCKVCDKLLLNWGKLVSSWNAK